MNTAKSTIIQAVLFDADGVLQKTPPQWLPTIKNLCTDRSRADEFLDDIFRAERPCLDGREDFATALAGVLRRWDCTTPADEVLKIWTMIETDPAIIDQTQQLRASDIRVALATNQQKHRAGYMLEHMGYRTLFDDIFCSCYMGHSKPSPEYFRSALSTLQLDPAQVLFFDDKTENVLAARKMGIQAQQFHLKQGVNEMQRLLATYNIHTDSEV